MECPMTVPVYENGQQVCQLHVTRRGLYYHFACACELTSHRILRVYAVRGLHIAPLGILMPQRERFELEESVSVRSWPLDTIDAAVCGYAPEAGAFPWRGTVDGVCVDGWLRKTDGGYELLLPDNGVDFPLPANLQDARKTTCGDVACLALRLDEAGALISTGQPFLKLSEREDEPVETVRKELTERPPMEPVQAEQPEALSPEEELPEENLPQPKEGLLT